MKKLRIVTKMMRRNKKRVGMKRTMVVLSNRGQSVSGECDAVRRHAVKKGARKHFFWSKK